MTQASWRNPHVYLELETVAADGKVTLQQIEAGPASALVAMGYGADSINKGDRLQVQAKPNRSGPGRVVLGWRLTKADGMVIPLHVRAQTSGGASAAQASGLAGVWVPQAPGFSSLAVAARDWPLTDKARAVVAASGDARAAQRAACVPFGPPALMAVPSAVTVEVGAAAVTFEIDAMNVRRIVHLDQRSHPAALEPSALGHSIGHWEGGTLVVDTAGFSAQPEGYAFDLPSGATKHIVERFTLSVDRKHLDYDATVEDGEILTAPVTHHSQWDYRPDLEPSNLPCDAEAARRFTTNE